MSTNLSVIKNPHVQSDQRRLVRRPDVKPNRPLIVILSTVALDAVGIGLIMPVLPGPPARSGSLERRHRPLWHSAGAVCVDAICLRTCAGRAVGSFRAAAGLARLAGRRCCRLRHHGDGAFPLGSLYRADRGRHHRGDWGGSRRYIADITRWR